MTNTQTPNDVSAAAEAQRSGGTPPASGELIRRHITDDHICILTFDRPDSSANVFDSAALTELNAHLDYVVCNPNLKGVVLASAKKSIFIAGADLTQLAKAKSVEAIQSLIELGQYVFQRLATLPLPTVAAIHGACLGGGYEVCLACDYRIASSEKATKLGLPETQLGILPAWGGSTRLPRLVGLPKALDLILGGKVVAAKPALKYGMIDAIAPREYLLEEACRLITKHGLKLRERPGNWKAALTNVGFVAKWIGGRAEKQVLLRTRGHYPAPLKALSVVTQAAGGSFEQGMALERQAVLELGQSEVSRNLLRIFFLQERAKKLTGFAPGFEAPHVDPVKNIAVVGAGVMGAGIAQWASAREINVILRDINHEAVGKGMTSIGRLFEQGVKRHALAGLEARAALDRISPTAIDVPLYRAELVIEAAVERMDLKKQLFARLGELTGPETILASNTSALSITELAMSTSHAERVVGIHFFNPVHKMQLVEVIAGRQTSPDVLVRAVKFVQQLGKLPVVVQDSPGFLVNRILMPYLVEAGFLFEHGARVEDIDESMLEFGMPMGPLRLIDEVGVDVAHHVATDLAGKFRDRMHAPDVLASLLRDGLLGKKSGSGFYVHGKGGRASIVNAAIDQYHSDTSCAAFSREELSTRMGLMMINESARCLEEGVVAEAADVDFGMIMGTGFAPFRGGPLRFADQMGIGHVVMEMKRLAEHGELRFTPCNLLQSMASARKNFYEQ